jgi:hypothetical protein
MMTRLGSPSGHMFPGISTTLAVCMAAGPVTLDL